MPPRKPPAADAARRSKPSDAISKAPFWKKAVVAALFFLIVLGALYAAGTFDNIRMGPKVPIARNTPEFTLGMSMEQVQAKYKKLKKGLRPFNGDKELRIVTLTPKEGYEASASADLLFFHDQLYFVSIMWKDGQAEAVPLEEWAKQSRRWRVKKGGDPETLGDDVLLREWHFNDGTTEMVLRDLKFNDSRQRWQELRDASNQPAQTAFSKYRLELGG